MTQKDKKKEAMAGLLGGLTKPSQQPEQLPEVATVSEPPAKPKAKRGRPPRSSKYDTYTVVGNIDQFSKMKVIAQNSGITLKDVLEKFVGNSLAKYEKVNGVVRVPRSGKVDLDSIFDE